MELTLDQALQKGAEAHKAGRVEEAERYYTAILKAHPMHPVTNHNMGLLVSGAGKVGKALPFFKKALELNPNVGQFWLSYINVLIQLDRIEDAQVVLDQARDKGVQGDGFDRMVQRINELAGKKTSTSPQETQVRSNILDPIKLDEDPSQKEMEALINLYTMGQLQNALSEANKLLLEYPSAANIYNIIGAINQGLGNLEEAIKAYKKAISIKPDYAEAHNNMGNAFKYQGKLEQAIDAYKKALSLRPDYIGAYSNMGAAFKEQGKLEQAIEAYKKAIALKPDYAEAYNNMGNALREQGKLEEAIEAYNKAIVIKPDYPDAYNNMGVVLNDQNKPQEAIEAYNKALAIRPDYAEVYNNMGITLQDQGKLEEAIEAYNKALSIKPDNAEVYNLLDPWSQLIA